ASAEALRRRAPGAALIHLSCHGDIDPLDPLASTVHLAGGDFTVRECLALRLSARLVALSACPTGLSAVRPGDNVVGFPRGLLGSGAGAVLLTLWSVVAATTSDWMRDFYGRVWDPATGTRRPKAFAFQQATLALRDRTPDPYHWAPFILVGDWR